jgi:hypothetical protein
MEIATDISQSLGAPVKVTENSEGFRTIVIALPAEARPGLGIIPYARIVETNQGVFVGLGDNGNGTSPLSKKLKDTVQQTLNRHGCSSWTFEEGTYDPVH